ncbi:hypothetical protein [Neptunicella sp. SCSIO 80796]|uniref:hypothetical protein n=1 Tax=Neptunicella plasticusilytica TaxID=3117012 RepID=UPI003A4DAFEB
MRTLLLNVRIAKLDALNKTNPRINVEYQCSLVSYSAFTIQVVVGMTKNVVIIGAGWLGQALGQKLSTGGLAVQMTTRNHTRATQPGWALFNADNDDLQHNISLQKAVWICCLPAGRTPESQMSYRHYLKTAISLAKKLNMNAFILCSTTGVYTNNAGLHQESDDIFAQSERQIRLLQSETLVTELGELGKVVRLAGLFGPQRHPGRFFEHKSPRSNGAETVNMIHQTDAVDAIHFIVQHLDQTPPIVNLVMPDHPTKAEFYQQAAQALNLPAPKFEIGEAKQRIISSQLLFDLGYRFGFDSLYAALQQS